MLKLALNKYERHLWNQPAGRTFEDPKVERAYHNLQRAKQHQNIGMGIQEFGTGTVAGAQAADEARIAAEGLVRKNRGNIYNQVKSPFNTKKDKLGNALSNDVLGKPGKYTPHVVQKDARKLIENIAKRPENKFLNRAKNYIRAKPVKAALIGLGVGATLGAVGYGIKKDLEA